MKTAIIALILFITCCADPFDRAINFVLAHEGGYCHDRGWESNYGICSKWYPGENIKNMTVERAKEIYRTDYWNAIGANTMSDTMLALVFLDCSVLFGQAAARFMLKNCFYDASALIELYILRIVNQVKDHPADVRYLKTWMHRIADLQTATYYMKGDIYVAHQ